MYKNNLKKKIPPLFLTLTFRENVTDIKFANRELIKFFQRLNNNRFKTKKSKLAYVAVPQFQKRGAVHYHCILFNMPFFKGDVYTFLRELWGHGNFVNLEKLDNAWKIYLYLRRYMVKDFQDGRLKRRKKYFHSKNMKTPIVLTYKDDHYIEYIIRSIRPSNLFNEYHGIFPTNFGDIQFSKYTLSHPLTIFDLNIDEYTKKHLKSLQDKKL